MFASAPAIGTKLLLPSTKLKNVPAATDLRCRWGPVRVRV